jgi:hypothetical protein
MFVAQQWSYRMLLPPPFQFSGEPKGNKVALSMSSELAARKLLSP